MPDFDDLQRHRRWLTDLWREFVTFRRTWDNLVERRGERHALPHLPGFPEVDVDIQSPELKTALNQFTDIVLRNQTKLDVIAQDQSPTSKKHVESIRIGLAISFSHQNDGDELRRYLVRGAQAHGISAVCKLWQLPEEPEDWPEQEEGESIADYAERGVRHREQHFSQWFNRNQMFSWRPVSMYNLKFWPLDKPEVYLEEQVLPYMDFRRLQNRDGNYVRLAKDKRVVFASQGEPVDEWETTTDMPTLTFSRLARKREDGYWWCEEYVSAGETTGGDGDIIQEKLDEYKVPFDHSPYFILTSGGEDTHQTNPHLRYWPQHMHPLITYIQEENYLTSALAERVVQRIISPGYIRVGSSNEDALRPFLDSGLFEVIEGAGAERRMVFKMPDHNAGEVMVVPEFAPWPEDDMQTLLYRLQTLERKIQENSPNRLLTGSAFDLATQGTGTALINQTSNAQSVFGRDAENLNAFTEDFLKAEPEAIVYWNKDADLPKPVILRTNGDEPLARDTRDAGDVVELTPEKLDHPFDIVASTSLETLQDQQLREQQADMAYKIGAIDKVQWLKRRGEADPNKQAEVLEKERLRLLYETVHQQDEMAAIRRLRIAFNGMLPSDQMPMPGAAPVGGAPTGQPIEQAPNPRQAQPLISPTPLGQNFAGSAPPAPGGIG